jgi:butyryl-CoA dehydrogenase
MTVSFPPAPLEADLLVHLAQNAEDADRRTDWPEASWHELRNAGVTAWSIPIDFGGLGLGPAELLSGYEQLASACLTTAFILSQREAAVRRLGAYPVPDLQKRFLPRLAHGDLFATVGLSQLTTSRQHQSPSLLADPVGPLDHPDHFLLDGLIPWVTGADHAEIVIVGAAIPDRRQVLLLLPAHQPGMTVEAPLPLPALAGSRTAQIRCERVRIGSELVLAGPGEKLLAAGKGGVGGLETSCLALGLARSAIDYLEKEAESRASLAELAARFKAVHFRLRNEMIKDALELQDEGQVQRLRVQSTQLVLRATQAALTVAKGTGFVAPHPVQRWARQALFFLVWSCPRPVADGLLSQLVPD